jgi:hypothetical protein
MIDREQEYHDRNVQLAMKLLPPGPYDVENAELVVECVRLADINRSAG